MVFRIFIFILMLPVFVLAEETSPLRAYCSEARPKAMCTADEGLFEGVRRTACETQMQTAKCDKLLKDNPSLQGKLRNCNAPRSCSLPLDANEFAVVCRQAFIDRWTDLGKGAMAFLFGDHSLPEVIKEREKLFAECTSPECKREMLGSFASYFSDEEIEGRKDKTGLDKNKPEDQNAYYGMTSAALYRQLLVRLKKRLDAGLKIDDYIEPWSGNAAKLPKNLNDMINDSLAKMGITQTECFDDAVLSEMRCYAFFAVLDSALIGAATAKVVSIAGRMGGGLERRLEQMALRENKMTSAVPYTQALEDKIKRIQTIAVRRKFAEDPFVQDISLKIAAGRPSVKYWTRKASLSAETKFEGDRFMVKVESVEANPGLMNFFGVTKAGREAGLNTTMTKSFYAVMKGASDAAKANPGIKMIRIDADHVINPSLKKNLLDMGFVIEKRQDSMGKVFDSLVMDVPVEKLKDLGF